MPTDDTSLQSLHAELALLRQELTAFKAQFSLPVSTPTLSPTQKPLVARRLALKRLAGVMLGGAISGAASLSSPQPAEAKMTANPTGNGFDNRVGTFITPPGAAAPTGTLAGTGKYGMIITGDSAALDLTAYPTGPYNYGLVALSQNDIGVFGRSTNSAGVWGSSTSGAGVYGVSTDSSGVAGSSSTNIGVFGYSTSSYGVYGVSIGSIGVVGTSNTSYGVSGYSTSSYGVYGYSSSGDAGYFDGSVNVTGTLYKGSNAFKIDHPTDPANKYLYHSVVESPDMLNLYNGNTILDATGKATITMPAWFEALNKDFRYQLTAIGGASPNLHISLKLNNGSFKIAGGTEGQEVSWLVTGIRQDAYANAHRIPVEEDKSGEERGKYLHPEAHGQPSEKGINYSRNSATSTH